MKVAETTSGRVGATLLLAGFSSAGFWAIFRAEKIVKRYDARLDNTQKSVPGGSLGAYLSRLDVWRETRLRSSREGFEPKE